MNECESINPSEPLRPRDLALLLLASGELLPRQRARDQQADVAGMQLKRRLLERLAVLDPEPADLEAALVRIVEEIGPPTGPTRALAAGLREEWQAACAAPEWVAQLLGEAVRHSAEDQARGRRIHP
ncbi:MAG TPA: hypothetical protein VNK04_15165 [Gemmataceae bacterium]|nr:hypothetical protein [Gemmataceae bacterium]